MSSIRIAARRVSSAVFAGRGVAPSRRVAVRLSAAVGLTAAAAATTSTTTGGPASIAVTNSRDRSVAHTSSSSSAATATAATAKPTHWAADADGINAEQRALAKITSSDPLERLKSAGTRELLAAACEVPGVVRATLAHDTSAAALHQSATATDEAVFLKKMEKEYGADVLPILRRQEWAVNIAPPTPANAARTNDASATLVCYFQEGTQRILWKRLSLA